MIHKLTALIMLTPREQDVCVIAYVRAARAKAAAAAAAAALKPLLRPFDPWQLRLTPGQFFKTG